VWSFRRSGGSRLPALWANRERPTDDPPRLTVDVVGDPGAGVDAVEVDVLNGRTRPLRTTGRDGRCVAEGIIVTDFPVFIRTTSSCIA